MDKISDFADRLQPGVSGRRPGTGRDLPSPFPLYKLGMRKAGGCGTGGRRIFRRENGREFVMKKSAVRVEFSGFPVYFAGMFLQIVQKT
ncbi:MAG: hypothetical protein HPZ91_19785 [Lentisphaeria bacterium]|nr:hypothetical protein [Lentisphaeria bacterium]